MLQLFLLLLLLLIPKCRFREQGKAARKNEHKPGTSCYISISQAHSESLVAFFPTQTSLGRSIITHTSAHILVFLTKIDNRKTGDEEGDHKGCTQTRCVDLARDYTRHWPDTYNKTRRCCSVCQHSRTHIFANSSFSSSSPSLPASYFLKAQALQPLQQLTTVNAGWLAGADTQFMSTLQPLKAHAH